jgi:hypothetical protein
VWDGDLGELAKDLVQATALLRQLPFEGGEPTSRSRAAWSMPSNRLNCSSAGSSRSIASLSLDVSD